MLWDAHRKRSKEIDDSVQDEINGALDDFDEATSKAEANIARLLVDLRRSPDMESLASRMQAVLDALAALEKVYRGHHSSGVCRTLPGVVGVAGARGGGRFEFVGGAPWRGQEDSKSCTGKDGMLYRSSCALGVCVHLCLVLFPAVVKGRLWEVGMVVCLFVVGSSLRMLSLLFLQCAPCPVPCPSES